ncbi:MAG TPA: hypothetical protein VEX60_17790 [Pyrinomonadaceae bacterium]|nr:hypothetical protein [Pyrinomonadaceae bacterium]
MNLTRAVGVLAGIMFVLGVAILARMILFPKQKPEGVEAGMPALAMEFVESKEELPKILGGPGDETWRDAMKRDLKFDYGLIVLYWLLFVGIAAVLARGGGRWAVWVAAAAAICATAAAASDVVENVRMERVIGAMDLVADIKTPGFLKWLSSFVAVALLSFTFFGRGGLIWVVGALCLLIAGLGFVGLALVKSGVRQLWPVELAFVLMLLMSGLVACAFIFRPGAFAPTPGSS